MPSSTPADRAEPETETVTAATLPLALEDVLQGGRLKRGELAVCVAVGAGFTVGATLMRWQ